MIYHKSHILIGLKYQQDNLHHRIIITYNINNIRKGIGKIRIKFWEMHQESKNNHQLKSFLERN